MGLRDAYREIAAELVEQGKALLARDTTRADEVKDWQKPALKTLHYLGADNYEAREARHGGFVEWAGSTFSERARKHNIRLTVTAIEDALLQQEPARPPARTESLPQQRPDLDESERLRLVSEAANTLGIALPRSIEWSSGVAAAYDPHTDVMVLPGKAHGYSAEEYKATAGHELQHKVQAESDPLAQAYTGARRALHLLARELVRSDDSLPLQLRATTMLAGASAYATFVLLGKTVGYQQELDADNASARVTSVEAAISSVIKDYAAGERPGTAKPGETWAERMTSRMAARISHALEDDHPSLRARIDNLRRQREDRPDLDQHLLR